MEFFEYENHEEFLDEVERFARTYVKKHASEIDSKEKLPKGVLEELAKRRLFVFEKLNNNVAALPTEKRTELIVLVIQILAKYSSAIAKLVLDQNFGQITMFKEFSKKHVWDYYLDNLQNGKFLMAFLMTEPQAGSNSSKFNCTATKGKEGEFIINGTKDWVTGAKSRLLYLILARSQINKNEFGLFLIDRSKNSDSISIYPKKKQLGIRGLGEHQVVFQNRLIPHENVLLTPCRTGLKKIMKHYNVKRCGQASIAIGIAKSSLIESYTYLKQRHPSKHNGIEFQNAEFAFSDMLCMIQASEELTKWAIKQIFLGDSSGTPSSIAKLFATESAIKITNKAIQLCGAIGTTQELSLERNMRDARMLTIAGGTSEILRKTIARNLPKLTFDL